MQKLCRTNQLSRYLVTLYVLSVLSIALVVLPASRGSSALAARPDKDERTRLTIEVTGGEGNKPVEQASVYVKFPKDGKDQNGKLIELNLKTNQSGSARSPEIPQGKVLIQIIAPGWKTFGEWHDITSAEQKIQIHLSRPPKWY